MSPSPDMPDAQTLYAQLKPAIDLVSNALIEMSEKFLAKLDNFLPHGALLTDSGEIRYVGVDTGSEDGTTTSVEVLPLLHQGLRFQATAPDVQATGVAENVTVQRPGSEPTNAIKVLFEHRKGLTVALYLPFEHKVADGYTFGEPFTVLASPEVCAWQDTP